MSIQDKAIDYLKAHPKATRAFCKVGDITTKSAFAGGLAVAGAVAANAEDPASPTTTVVDTLVSTAQSVVTDTYTKILPVLALIMGLNFGIRKIRGLVGG